VIGALFVGVGGAAAADGPGDGSAPDQYQEDIPTDTGSEPTDGGSDDGVDEGGAAPPGGNSSSGGGTGSTGGDLFLPPGIPGSGDPAERVIGPGSDPNDWTNYVRLGEEEVGGQPESSGGFAEAVSAVGEGSSSVLVLLTLALLIPLAAFAFVSVRARRRRV